MKMKQIFFTVVISALTTCGVFWGYSKFVKKDNIYAGQSPGTIPNNYKYAGFFDGDTPPVTVDFTQPAAASIPAVVHIKTKTNAKQINNNLPQNQRPRNPFGDIFDDEIFEQFFTTSISDPSSDCRHFTR